MRRNIVLRQQPTLRLNPYNGDHALSDGQRALYMVLNAIDNAIPSVRSVAVRGFRLPDHATALARMEGTPSPSRALSDLFWMHVPWQRLQRQLGSLRVLDLGCGNGRYAQRLGAWSGGRIDRYVGIDLYPHELWNDIAAANPFAAFRSGSVERLEDVIPADMRPNVIISQSALEHVRDDDACFSFLAEYMKRTAGPVLQMHAVPSAECLALYRWHGYRQYTPRTITRLTRAFDVYADRLVIRLGGPACNALHRRFIKPRRFRREWTDLRDAQPQQYRLELATAIAEDMRESSVASFYMVMLYSPVLRSLVDQWCGAMDVWTGRD
jgi:SAM-dependent methyltransferase